MSKKCIPSGPLRKWKEPTPIGNRLLWEPSSHIYNKALIVEPRTRSFGSVTGAGDWWETVPVEVKDLLLASPWRDFISTLTKIPPNVDRAACLALLERWWDTTHTFHLPIGEFTVRPHDIAAIAGVRSSGKPVKFKPDLHTKPCMLMKLIGFVPSGVDSSGKIPYVSFQNQTKCHAKSISAVQYARCFLAYAVSTRLLVDCGNHLSLDVLGGLKDINVGFELDWAGATLASMYLAFDSFVRGIRQSLGGYLYILEIWAYSLGIFPAPCITLAFVDPPPFPKAIHWVGRRKYSHIGRHLSKLRMHLNHLTFDNIISHPWGRKKHWPDYLLSSHFRTNSRVLLHSLFGPAWYLGERVCKMTKNLAARTVPLKPPYSMLFPEGLSTSERKEMSQGEPSMNFLDATEDYLSFISNRLFHWPPEFISVIEGWSPFILNPSCGKRKEAPKQEEAISSEFKVLRPPMNYFQFCNSEGVMVQHPIKPATSSSMFFAVENIDVPYEEVDAHLRCQMGTIKAVHEMSRSLYAEMSTKYLVEKTRADNLARKVSTLESKVNKLRATLAFMEVRAGAVDAAEGNTRVDSEISGNE